MSEILEIVEAARRVGVTPEAIRGWVAKGRIDAHPGVRPGPNGAPPRRVDLAECEALARQSPYHPSALGARLERRFEAARLRELGLTTYVIAAELGVDQSVVVRDLKWIARQENAR